MEQDVDLPRVKFDPDAGIDSSESQRDCDSDGSMVKPKKNAADREESPPRVTRDVKSTAVVKYSNVQTVANFSKLEEDTDLKLPPANWLRSGANVTVHNTMGTSKTKFSSFGMANSCPDTVGDVDVISAAENIKDLLKIPFSKGQVSIAVHRIGRSLFLDEFDVYRHLRSAPQSGRKWLRNFILQQILRDNKKFTRKKKTRDDLHSRNLLSKFLYYSIDSVPESDGACNSTYTVEEPDDISPDQSSTNSSSHTIKDDISFSTGDISQSHQSEFARQVLWQFEDIQMLIGTDLPIFGGGQYPAVSLRLRDMSKPINVLTGLDYWLDNLICNVPELAMCYHLDGIVKNYELLRTEEIPQIPDSQFSPTVVKDIAQNVLSFLKSNCTKEGHTYWLFKGNNDDVVKLYDLTSLCSENDVNNTWDNPFAVPVALLLYNVAKNMKQSNDRDWSTISQLLKNCLSLLDKDKNPQIFASANFLLSDMFISDEPHKDKSEDDDFSDEDHCHGDNSSSSSSTSSNDEDEKGCHGEEATKSLDVKSLSLPSKHWHWREVEKRGRRPSHNHGNSEQQKCLEAIKHIVQGLQAIDSDVESNPLLSGNSPCAIEFPTTSKDDSGSSAALEKETAVVNQPEMTVARRRLSPGSWQGQMKISLFKKARAVFYVMGNIGMRSNNYGEVLRNLHLSLMCHSAVSSVLSTSAVEKEGQGLLESILSLCGDVHVMLAASSSDILISHKDNFLQSPEYEKFIMQSVQKEVNYNNFEWASSWSMDAAGFLATSIRCYEFSVELLCDDKENADCIINITRRLANSRNELGKLYMKQAVDLAAADQNDDEIPSQEEQELWKKSYSCFDNAIQSFDAVHDSINQALVNCNAGRLMRICAQAYNIGRFSQQERHYYNKAIIYYQAALSCIGEKPSHIRESVCWELSSTYFTIATLLQDNAPLAVMAQEQVERDINDLMMKAIKYCDVNQSSPQYPIVRYRAATIHHRLASMHHNSYRNQVNEQKRKQGKSLTELHYGKAIKLFQELDRPSELLRVLLERVAMSEHQFNNQTGSGARMKALHVALDLLLQSEGAVESINRTLTEEATDTLNSSDAIAQSGRHELLDSGYCKMEESGGANAGVCEFVKQGDAPTTVDKSKMKELEEQEKLLSILLSRIQFVLLNLVKLHSNKKSDHDKLSRYKKMYGIALMCEKLYKGNLVKALQYALKEVKLLQTPP